jgi:putative redox protein
MADSTRSLTLTRSGPGTLTATNVRGGTMTVISGGEGAGAEFSPIELLLAAIGGCTALDVEAITGKRAEPTDFEVQVEAQKVRDDAGANRLTDIVVTFRIAFPDGEAGDAARAVLPDAVAKSHDRLCTVSRTVELGTPITPRIEP